MQAASPESLAGRLGAPSMTGFQLNVRGSRIQVVIDSGYLGVSRQDVIEWVKQAAESVTRYYGRFPVSRAVVRVNPQENGGIGFASATYEDDGGYAYIEAALGRATTRGDLLSSWTLTHEMVHLGFPIVDDRHKWLAEGIATYVEPIARMRQGIISEEDVWSDMVHDMPQGQPLRGDRGLTNTHTWGRTYWGGAIYCLMADMEIRRRTGNRFGLEDALRAIDRTGGAIDSDLSAQDAIKIGDRAVGVPVLSELYDKMSTQPVRVDLDKVWKELGVTVSGDTVEFDDSAPLAGIRKAINGTAAIH